MSGLARVIGMSKSRNCVTTPVGSGHVISRNMGSTRQFSLYMKLCSVSESNVQARAGYAI